MQSNESAGPSAGSPGMKHLIIQHGRCKGKQISYTLNSSWDIVILALAVQSRLPFQQWMLNKATL